MTERDPKDDRIELAFGLIASAALAVLLLVPPVLDWLRRIVWAWIN